MTGAEWLDLERHFWYAMILLACLASAKIIFGWIVDAAERARIRRIFQR